MAVIVTYATLVQVHGFQPTWVGSPRWTTDIRHISPMTGVPQTGLEHKWCQILFGNFRLQQLYCMPYFLSSATHHMGLEVSTNTVSSSGTRWFDVDSNPSNPE